MLHALMRGAVSAAVGVGMVLAIANDASAQGEFVNFESGQVRPIEVGEVTIDGNTGSFLFICNTPDDCLEIYEAASPFTFIKRIPTGLNPVTVRYVPEQDAIYTCNFLGDSITRTYLNSSISGNSVTIAPLLDRTMYVGDEPADLVYFPNEDQIMVTLHSQRGMALLNGTNLSVITPLALADFPLGGTPPSSWILHNPTYIERIGTDRIHILDRHDDDEFVDFDLLSFDGSAPGNGRLLTGGLGTTHHSMTIDSSGTKMFVVGMDAQQLVKSGEAEVKLLKTGFVQSWMWVLDLAPGTAPTRRNEGLAVLPSINLNRNYNVPALTELDRTLALAQPAGVALIEGASGIEQIVVTALSSDRVAFLTPNSNTMGGYDIARVALPAFNPASSHPGYRGESGYSTSGPSGVAVANLVPDPNQSGATGLVYVAGAFDNSVTVLSPTTHTEVYRFQLRHDGTTNVIRKGREFLYAAEHSKNAMVSCSSCHIWGGTDSIRWDLGGPAGPAIHPWLRDDLNPDVVNFPPNKGKLVTQTLHGLVNSTVEGAAQAMFSNAPYHWRGDKDGFQDFNEAFVNLMRKTPEGEAKAGNGLTDAHMNEFTAFIETIRHEPNPRQAKDRRIPGDLGEPDLTNSGSGVARGLKAFHIEPMLSFGRSCVHCHSSPEGSNNRLPLTFNVGTTLHSMESAAVRSLIDREGIVEMDSAQPQPNDYVYLAKSSGLNHNGLGPFDTASINTFISSIPRGGMTASTQSDVIEFVRQYDSGVAPIIGLPWTMTGMTTIDQAIAQSMIDQVEEANAGLAVYRREGTTETGWWLDLTAGTNMFRREGSSDIASLNSFLQLAQVESARVILQSVPVGSARRYAAFGADTTQVEGPVPTQVAPLPMAPATHWTYVSNLAVNWDSTHPRARPMVPVSASIQAVQDLGQAVKQAQNNFGLRTDLQHEPPRRFRVSGDDIRPGAKLGIAFPFGAGFELIWIPVFPTKYFDGNNRRIWETTVEADDQQTLGLLCGSIWTPGVVDVMRYMPPSSPLNPDVNNNFIFSVLNEDGDLAAPAWNSLSVTYNR